MTCRSPTKELVWAEGTFVFVSVLVMIVLVVVFECSPTLVSGRANQHDCPHHHELSPEIPLLSTVVPLRRLILPWS